MSDQRPTVYIETSVPSYLVARPSTHVVTLAHQQLTHKWWDTRRDFFECVVSIDTLEELSLGDPVLAQKRLALVTDLEVLPKTANVSKLIELYKQRLGLTGAAQGDMPHFAFSVAYRIEYLMTWNCAHIANGRVMRRLELINQAMGLHTPIILTPQGLLAEGDGGESDDGN